MDDLDEELFGSILKSKSKSKTKGKWSSKNDIDFDEDDPLAGLLSDTEDKLVDRVKQPAVKLPDNYSLGKAAAIGLLPHSPPPTTKPRNALEALLAKSDVAQRSQLPAKQEFVLGDSYRQTEGARGSTLNDAVKHDENGVQFGGYVPSAVQSRPSDIRRPKTASSLGAENTLKLVADEGQSTGYVSRQGRHFVPATTESLKRNAETIEGRRLNTMAGSLSGGQTRQDSLDWLEIKDTPKSTANQQNVHGPDRSPQVGASNSNLTRPGASSSSERNADWLGISVEKPKAAERATIETTAGGVDEKASFLEWVGAKSVSAGGPEVGAGVHHHQTVEPIMKEVMSPHVSDRLHTVVQGQPDAQDRVHPRAAAPSVREVAGLPAVPQLPTDVADLSSEYEKRMASLRTQMADMHVKFCEESLTAASVTLDLQTKVRRLEFERDQAQRSLEGLENRHREELDSVEGSFKKRVQLIEDSYQRREQRLQEEVTSISEAQAEKQKAWDRERSEMAASWKRKLDETTRERIEDLERLKELHRQTVTDMKKDHEIAIGRLQQIKKLEVDAMSEATSHARTLQLVIEQLQSNTSELNELQCRVEGGRVSGLEERELLLETKDRQLKALQEQLQKQREQNEQERLLLRQLISRLEDKLQQQTEGQEQERWKLTQDRNNLETERKLLEESKRSTLEQLEKDKRELQKTRESFLEEQKDILQQIYGQNHSPSFNSSSTRYPSKTAAPSPSGLETFHSLKASVESEAALKFIERECKRIDGQSARLTVAGESLEKDRAELEGERSAINTLAIQVKQRSEEIEEMCLSATQTREEGYAALREAQRLQAEVQRRQEVLVVQTEGLKKKECHLVEERLTLARQKKEIERLSANAQCAHCGGLVAGDELVSTSRPGYTSVSLGMLDPMLMAWQIAAKQDQEFLKRESLFLKGLRADEKLNHTSPVG